MRLTNNLHSRKLRRALSVRRVGTNTFTAHEYTKGKNVNMDILGMINLLMGESTSADLI